MVRHFPILENSETELSVDPRNGRRNSTTRSALLWGIPVRSEMDTFSYLKIQNQCCHQSDYVTSCFL